MRVMLFDTETTGLLLPDGASLDKQPKIIEFAAVVADQYLNEIESLEFLVDPGFSLHAIITKITGIKQEDVDGKGDWESHHQKVIDLINSCDVLIAHNINFDVDMIKNDMKRIVGDGYTANDWIKWGEKRTICTVEATYHIKNKRMNLGKAYEHLTGKPAPPAHRALDDVRTLLRVSQELLELGWITL